MLAGWRDARGDLDPEGRVFALPHLSNVLSMLRADLDAAGIVYQDADGRFADFHALRHTFISNLPRGGVTPMAVEGAKGEQHRYRPAGEGKAKVGTLI